MRNSRLLLLETVEDAHYFVDTLYKKDQRLNNCDILSFQPDIQAFLLENNIESISSAEISIAQLYYDVMDKLDEIENYILKNIKIINSSKPDPWFVNAFEYYFRYASFYLLWDIEVLFNILKEMRYKMIIGFKCEGYTSSSPWILPEQRLLSEMAKQICDLMKIDYLSFKKINKHSYKKRNKRIQNSSLLRLCNNIAYHIYCYLASKCNKNTYLFVDSFSNNIDNICQELIKQDIDIGILTYGDKKEGIKELKTAIKDFKSYYFKKKITDKTSILHLNIPIHTFYNRYHSQYDSGRVKLYINSILHSLSNSSVMKYRNIDIYFILKEKVINDILEYLINIDMLVFGLKKGLKAYRPKYVLSTMSLGLSSALGYIGNNLGLTTILISHGSHVLHDDKNARKENEMIAKNILVGDYRYLAVQSPLARKMAENFNNDSKKIININPVVWGKKVNKCIVNNSDQITIMHAGTFKEAQRRFMYETSDEMLMGIKDLCNAVSGKNFIKLIIKFRYRSEFSTETLKSLIPDLPDNIFIETEKNVLEILRETDLLISFSSTTIEEALVNRIPVLLYGGHGRYAHIPVNPFSNENSNINKPVTFIKNKNELENYFIKLNNAGKTFRIPNEEFNKYRFNDDDSVDFVDWFSELIDQPMILKKNTHLRT